MHILTLGQEKSRHHDYYGPSQDYQGHGYNDWNQYHTNYKKASNSVIGDIILLIVAAIVLYALYKTCFDNNRNYADREYR